MRSLKIIIFRDTDKPYTMILSPSLLAGVAFSAIAVFSLLVFSVLGNLILFSEEDAIASPTKSAAGEEASGQHPETGDRPGGPASDGGDGTEGGSAADGEFAIDSGTSEIEGDGDSAELIAPWTPSDSPYTVFLLGQPEISGDEIAIRTRVEKTVDLGVSVSGYFVAALITDDNQIGPVYPERVQIEGTEVINPERGSQFRIRYRKDDIIRFSGIDAKRYTALVFYLFDEETKQLQWRNIEPISR